MRTQSFVVLGIAALLGLLAVVALNFFMQSGAPGLAAANEKPATIEIVAASGPVAFGSPIEAAKLKLVRWPADLAPKGAFHSIGELTQQRRFATRPISENEPLLETAVTAKGQRLSLSGMIDVGQYAVSIPVNDVVGVGGFLLPNDRVDVLVTRTPLGPEAQPITNVLLQDVKVIGIDQTADPAVDKPAVVKTVTVQVTQVQAQKLALAQRVGNLNLVLRPNGARSMGPTRTVRVADLRDGAAPALGPARPRRTAIIRRAPPSLPTVQVVRGTALSLQPVLPYRG
jgi:pilus assembly protein CpaB